MDVIALDGLTESRRAQVLNHLVSAGYDAIDDDREVFGLFESSLLAVENHPEVIAVVDYVVELSRIKFVV